MAAVTVPPACATTRCTRRAAGPATGRAYRAWCCVDCATTPEALPEAHTRTCNARQAGQTGQAAPATARQARRAGLSASQGSRHDLRTAAGVRADIHELRRPVTSQDDRDHQALADALHTWAHEDTFLLPPGTCLGEITEDTWHRLMAGANRRELMKLRDRVLDARRARTRAAIDQVEIRRA